MHTNNIKTHNTEFFRHTYMQPGQLVIALLTARFGTFFIVKVEDMFRQIPLPFHPNRATIHTFTYLISGKANLNLGSSSYTIYKDECLLVPAGLFVQSARR